MQPKLLKLKRIAFYTLGCKLNFSETSTIARQMEAKGFAKVDFTQGADIYVINTCSVTDHADKKCRKVVKEALKYNPEAFIAVVGCYAQLKPQEIADIPGVDVVLGASEKFMLAELIPQFEKKDKAIVFNKPVELAQTFIPSFSVGDRTRTFLKVQDGCDYNCSFCTIPLARGSSRSTSPDEIMRQLPLIAESGVKEVVLTGVNLGDYGIVDGKRIFRFLELAKEIDGFEAISRFRISSIEPNLLTNEIIDFVSESRAFVPHFHIPLQSGSNKTLSAMRRRYKRELYAERVERIKEKMPHCCIGVDVIVGFPGETDADFEETYQFLNELNISYLHVFTYSERANTYALGIKGVVPGAVRQERNQRLTILSEKKRRAFYEKFIGSTLKVLFEDEREGNQMLGFTDNYIRVTAPYDPLWVNEVVEVSLDAINAEMRVEVSEVLPVSV